jgi:G6PDH family F420-dependent oxidoreductase
MRFGYFLSCEDYTPAELVEQARLAAEAGFTSLFISDHYHPWTDEQGQSPFVWSVIGAVSQVCDLPIITAVTCPTVRIHPAIVAQAAATSAVMTNGRFILGVGSGEALNEHILGDAWPTADVRLEMLEEAVEVMRALWTGEVVNHDGRYYTVDHARIYTLPESPPEVYVSGFGPKAIELAANIGDGFISTKPEAESLEQFRKGGGAGKPTMAATKGCWAPTKEEGLEIAHRLWPNEGLPGELAQVLPTPEHFMQASTLVTPEQMKMPHGPDPEPYLETVEKFQQAGYDVLHVGAVGPHYRELIKLFKTDVLPRVAA